MKSNMKREMEAKAQRGELEGVSKHAIFDNEGNLFLDFF